MDNPKKKGADAKRRSQQPHELAYQRKKAAKKVSTKTATKKKAVKKVAKKRRATTAKA